jgi:hypothetical protein
MCGDHTCDADEIIGGLGDDTETFGKMRNAVTNRKRGGYCRAIIVNPQRRGLPKLVVMVQCTCNKFTRRDVRAQWTRLRELWNRPGGLHSILGPLVGNGSDGDQRRASEQMSDMASKSGERFTFPWSGMTLTARLGTAGDLMSI